MQPRRAVFDDPPLKYLNGEALPTFAALFEVIENADVCDKASTREVAEKIWDALAARGAMIVLA